MSTGYRFSELPADWQAAQTRIGASYALYADSFPGVLFTSLPQVGLPKSPMIDPMAAAQVLSLGYPMGNRSLIRGLERLPWYAEFDGESWLEGLPPGHGQKRPAAPQAVAAEFLKRVSDDLAHVVRGKAHIGVMLSGGLDSRIAAGCLRQLQLAAPDRFEVSALTWGVEASLDVQVAREIANRFGWRWEFFSLSASDVRANIFLGGELGAEFSPLHLHAMSRIRQVRVDAIIAGTYGDSIGRGEYSGTHVTELKPLESGLPFDHYGLLDGRVLGFDRAARRGREVKAGSGLADAGYSPETVSGGTAKLPAIEQAHQRNYLRRLLSGAMAPVAEAVPLWQAFAGWNVVELMWSLAPGLRRDHLYEAALESLPDSIGDLPWPRTGRSLKGARDLQFSGSKRFHRYRMWLRANEDVVEDAIRGTALLDLGLIDRRAALRLLETWRRVPRGNAHGRIDFVVSWLASLGVAVETYGLSFDSHSSLDYESTMPSWRNPRLQTIKAEAKVAVKNWRQVSRRG